MASLCIVGHNCDKASQAYYQSNPGLQDKVKTHARQLHNYVPEALLYSAPAVAALVTRHKRSIRVYGPFYLATEGAQTLLIYKRTF